jgi:hypothetical protein
MKIPEAFAHWSGTSPRNSLLALYSVCFLLIVTPVVAQEMGMIPYDTITVPPAIPIYRLTTAPASGGPVSGAILFSDGRIGKAFKGLSVQERDFYGELFDNLVGLPEAPLSLEVGESDANLWAGDLESHDGRYISGVSRFGSRQVGAGSVTILFDEPVCQFGFKARVNSHLRPISGNYLRGPIGITFYSTDGDPLGEFFLGNGGESQFGFSLPTGSIPIVQGLAIENIDADGIQITDMKFLAECMPFVS